MFSFPFDCFYCLKSFVVVQLLSLVQHFATPWTAACPASLSFTILLKLMSVELVMPSTISSCFVHFSSCLQSFLASGSFLMSRLFASSSQILELQLQHQFFQWIFRVDFLYDRLISLQSKRLSRVFSSTTVWTHQFLGAQPSLWSNSHICIWLLEKP